MRAFSKTVLSILSVCMAVCLAAMPAQAEGYTTVQWSGLQSPQVGPSPNYKAPDAIGETREVAQNGRTHVVRFLDGAPETGIGKRPVILLLHGANRDGRSMLDTWRGAARSYGFLLVAPDSSGASWDPSLDSPAALEAMLQAVAGEVPVDAGQLYLFGHSAGGVYAQLLANRLPTAWRAVATHAGTLQADAVQPAVDAPPIRMYLGSRDALFPVTEARATATRLAEAGHTTSLVEIPGHTHWYYDLAVSINEAAARFFLERP